MRPLGVHAYALRPSSRLWRDSARRQRLHGPSARAGDSPAVAKVRDGPPEGQPYFSNLGTRDELRANLKEVKITGLSQVRRSGDCSQPGYSSPGRLTVSCNVLLDRLSVNIVSDIRYMGGPRGLSAQWPRSPQLRAPRGYSR
ncbi:hypothetical protein HPB47_018940 [Ixodes persulcatus]|uniref:Uncharacterized protein n=1 Tax=Ixodes persulcatus TaxID=34615 RepID=A0AC60R0K3_IXOPE|nr:hypothetical protein HPB47_018940 [Ixodes persulcatus]